MLLALIVGTTWNKNHLKDYFKFYLSGSTFSNRSIQTMKTSRWDLVKGDCGRLIEVKIKVIEEKQIQDFDNRPLNTVPLNICSTV